MVAQRLTDLALAQRATSGDQEAWAKIFHTYRSRIHRLMLKMVGTEEAEDLVQDVFLQLHRKLHLFRGQSQLSTYIYRVSINVGLMHLRRRRLQTISLDSGNTCDDIEAIDVADEKMDSTELRIALERAIDGLPEARKLHFLLHHSMGWEHREIVAKVGGNVSASKKQTRLARQSLRRNLRPNKELK